MVDEITKKKLLEIIRACIDEVVYDEMRQLPEKLKTRQEEIKKTKAQRAQDAHDALFGTEEEIRYKLRLHETNERPRISSKEFQQFEKEFKNRFPGISFKKQLGPGQNGQIVDFPIRNGQKDAITSGEITIGDEAIGFTMSLLNGFKIKNIIENGNLKTFEINKETKDVFGKILNLFEEIFKEKFNQILNPSENTEDKATTPVPAPTATPPMEPSQEDITSPPSMPGV